MALRIVAVCDTHLYHGELVVPDGDVFIHAGDMCRGGDLEELAIAAAFVRSLPHATKIVVAGNHDWSFVNDAAAARALFEGFATYLEDEETSVSGVRIYGSPWQPEFNDWAFNLPRGEALRALWSKIPAGLDVLVTHGPPSGIGDRSGMGAVRAGCEELRAAVRTQKPRVHLFGHIHEDGGAWQIDDTLFANVTTWECERAPTVIDYDVDTRTATVIAAPPARR
jgi:Icc-related predicted phosphoesterase